MSRAPVGMAALAASFGLGLLLAACKRTPPLSPQLPEVFAPPAPQEAPAGVILDSVFHDAQLGLTLRLPPGWTGTVGSASGSLRLRATGDRAPPTVVEVWRSPAGTASPLTRAGCVWTFQDPGPHLGLPGTELLTLATCTPEAPSDPRIYAWIVERGPDLWQFDVTAPWPRLLEAEREGAGLLSTLRWGERPN